MGRGWTIQFDAENTELVLLISSRSRNLHILIVVSSNAYWERQWTSLIIVNPMTITVGQTKTYEPYFLADKISPSLSAIAAKISTITNPIWERAVVLKLGYRWGCVGRQSRGGRN